MKIRICAALLIAFLTVSLLSACSVGTTLRTLDAAEDAVEYHLDAAEDRIEDAVLPPAAPPPTVSEKSAPAETAPLITAEEALSIALEHAGFTAGQVKYLHTEFEIDDRIPQYDVNFHEGHWEYEYEIHAETGAILSYERDT